MLISCCLSPSEAIAETFGSVMKKYQNTWFFNPGPTNDDVRLRKEMFIRLDGPKLGVVESPFQRIADRLVVKPTASYASLHPDHRDKKVSKVMKRMLSENRDFIQDSLLSFRILKVIMHIESQLKEMQDKVELKSAK